MWVKICGNTNLEDARLAVELGADAVGFVFAPSKRQVTPVQAAQISPHLPSHAARVGVFPEWSPDSIVAAVDQAGLTAVQLHGIFDPALALSLRSKLPTNVQIIQVLHWTIGQTEPAAAVLQLQQIQNSGVVDRILVDSKVGSATGGTGIAFDWSAAQSLFASHPGLILAGGLHAQNVLQAMEKLRPWGVDVASGVEISTGKKDPEKMALFIAEAKRQPPI